MPGLNKIVPKNFLENIIAPFCNNDERILNAFKEVPRGVFVDEALQKQAYSDNALPIGFGQTISQPSLVSQMLYELELDQSHKCLEIGFGSGFVTVLLSKLVNELVSIEYLPELYKSSYKKVRSFMVNNVRMILSDGSMGYEDAAPYQRILVSAGANSFPQALGDQLAEGGIMIIPVRDELLKVTKNNGVLSNTAIAKVSFVEFINT